MTAAKSFKSYIWTSLNIIILVYHRFHLKFLKYYCSSIENIPLEFFLERQHPCLANISTQFMSFVVEWSNCFIVLKGFHQGFHTCSLKFKQLSLVKLLDMFQIFRCERYYILQLFNMSFQKAKQPSLAKFTENFWIYNLNIKL